jgi:hypothetical protein
MHQGSANFNIKPPEGHPGVQRFSTARIALVTGANKGIGFEMPASSARLATMSAL